MFNHTKLVMFDFDGTLVDSAHHHADAFRHAMFKWNPHKAMVLRYGEIAGQQTHTALRHIGVPEDRVDEIAEAKRKKFRQLVEQKPIKLFPKAKELLEMLKTRYRLALVTGAALRMETLEQLGIRQYFDNVVTSALKPRPDGLQLCMKEMNIEPHEAVMVEDSFSGLLAAAKAQVYCIGVHNPKIRTYVDYYGISLEKMYASLRSNPSSR